MRAIVVVSMLDGTKQKASGELAPMADRIAFERRFGQSAAVLTRIADSFDSSGKLLDGIDASGIREEWIAFLAWRTLSRGGTLPAFDDWMESVSEVALEVLEGEEPEAVPTETAAPLPTS